MEINTYLINDVSTERTTRSAEIDDGVGGAQRSVQEGEEERRSVVSGEWCVAVSGEWG